MLTDLEKVGRYLCKAYYNGELRPSETLATCVEECARNNSIWLSLLSGDLTHLNKPARYRVTGGRALREELLSIDGCGEVSVLEVALYAAVGKKLLELLKLSK